MSVLFPRLLRSTSQVMYEEVDSLDPATEHPAQIFAPVGGRRASSADVASLALAVRDLAIEHGFPSAVDSNARLAFDRRTARLLVELLPISWSEAAATDMWSFISLVALPDVTRWRFGTTNIERWIASDLTRHTWSRAWWRGTVFDGHLDLLDELSESDLNQILERRAIGGDSRLVVSLSEALVKTEESMPGRRRELIRGSASRLRRRLAFIDARSLDETEMKALCGRVVTETAAFLLTADSHEPGAASASS